MKRIPALVIVALAGVCLAVLPAAAANDFERTPVDRSPVILGGSVNKATVDTVTLMGPDGRYPYRGDFETASAMPGGDGQLPDGWTSSDLTAPANHWHVATFNNPGTGPGAWCGDIGFEACDGSDVAGGYGNNWRDVLEFRKTVGATAASVRVQAALRYDTEPGYDYVTLQRRTTAYPNLEPVAGGQGLAWDGEGQVAVDHTFNFTPAELLGGTDVAVAFVFDSDGAWSDSDCLWPTAGAATVDDILVTVTTASVVTYSEDFADGVIGPDWRLVPNTGVGDYARVWQGLCDEDPCDGNSSKQVAFIDFYPGMWRVAPPPAGCGMVNYAGGFLGPNANIYNEIRSPILPLPGGSVDGALISFDIYQNEPIVGIDYPGICWYWQVRSCVSGADISVAPWVDRNFVYYGAPDYKRMSLPVGDLLVADAAKLQVSFGIWQPDHWSWPDFEGSSAPYFDNVRVQAYPSAGPRIMITEVRLPNDGFPASGALDLGNLASNSVRFDMAANISARSHLRNDPGDSIWIDATPRSGATLDPPLLHWTLARRNPVFDAVRTLPANPVAGRVTRAATGAVVANRWNFDLPDSGFLYPGDVLHYYFSATDHRGGDARTSIAPPDLTGYGDAGSATWPGNFRLRCLPSVSAGGQQPMLLFWNDQGFRGAEDEWELALKDLGLLEGVDFDVFTTRSPTSGVGNGLGGRATVAQVSGYTDLLYTAGDASSPTLSNGDFASDPGNDLALVNGWLGLGGRDLMLCGEDLANSLSASGLVARAFLGSTMGLQYVDGDVRDNLGGQASPGVVKVPGNPVFTTANAWLVYGGCPTPNDSDAVLPLPGTVAVANFTDAGGSTPYPYPAVALRSDGTNRVLSLPYDLSFVMSWGASSAPLAQRAVLLSNVIDYFNVSYNPTEPTDVPGAGVAALAVTAQPNPFNPSVNLRYSLPRPGHLVMKVFDARGALVRTLVDGPVATTVGVVTWDGADDRGGQVSSGLYFVETRADGQVDVRKVTMLK